MCRLPLLRGPRPRHVHDAAIERIAAEQRNKRDPNAGAPNLGPRRATPGAAADTAHQPGGLPLGRVAAQWFEDGGGGAAGDLGGSCERRDGRKGCRGAWRRVRRLRALAPVRAHDRVGGQDQWIGGPAPLDLTRGRAWAPVASNASDGGDWTTGRLDRPAARVPRHLGEEEVRDSDSAESEAARMYSRCAATAARAGQAPDPEPKCRGGVQGSAGHQVDGLREPGQPRCGSHDCPRVAGRGAGQSAGAAVGDQREAVRSGGRARHPCRHHSGERDLIQAEGGGRCGAYGDGKTGSHNVA